MCTEVEIVRDLHIMKRQALEMKKDPALTLEALNKGANSMNNALGELRRLRTETGKDFEHVDKLVDTIWLIFFQLWAKVCPSLPLKN
jgi:hypothetical protein